MLIPPLNRWCNSWVVTDKRTGLAVFETWEPSILEKLNPELAQVENSYDYLCRISSEIKVGSTKYNTKGS